MENEKNKNFFKLVLQLRTEIENFDLEEWKKIVKPEDPLYDSYFEKCLQEKRDKYERGKTNDVVETKKEKRVLKLNKRYFQNMSRSERFYFLLNLKEMMETSWLLAHKRMAGIKSEEQSDFVNADDIIKYSEKLADTVCAPPDYDNVEDKALHLQYYPNYHFLNFVNIEEMHMSKLFQLQKYSTVCFPPVIYIKEKNEMLTIYISCTTPNATIYYRVNNDAHERIYDYMNKPRIRKNPKVSIYAWSAKEGHMKSRVSCYSKTFKGVKAISAADTLLPKHVPSSTAKGSSSIDIEKEKLIKPKIEKNKKVFKNLGFLLNREKEKKPQGSSSDLSSSEDSGT